MAIAEVIQYNGTPDVFAWKYPNEELRLGSQLIVNETQEAVLYKGGQALDVFAAGRHTLATGNIYLLNQLINLPFGGTSPFRAEIWYVNKVHALDIKWGTPSPIQLQDPKYKVFLPLRSFGQFGIQIEDSRKFLTKLVGTLSTFSVDDIRNYFKGLYLTKVRDGISTYLIKNGISALEINAYVEELSTHLQERMSPIMAEYGIKLVNFYVNDINVIEEDSSVVNLKKALSKKAEMDIVGFSYAQERSFDTLESAAQNPGSAHAGVMGAGLGLGMGMNMGAGIGQQFAGMASMLNVKDVKKCPGCIADMEANQRFCPTCGYDTRKNEADKTKVVEELTVCNTCGHKYSKQFKFCPECGDKYVPCRFCGMDIAENAQACPHCGKGCAGTCPKCNTILTNPKANFCPECGEALLKKCISCGKALEGSPKFCQVCGAKQ